jgi:hypothetical protein
VGCNIPGPPNERPWRGAVTIAGSSRLAKFLLLLGSDKPGEVVAAAAALCRTLKSDGHDLRDLVGALNGHVVYRDKIVEKTKVV